MFDETILLFKALSDTSRLKIVVNLLEKPSYVELLSERLDLAASTVSFHLKKLEKVGLVTSKKEQYYTMYELNSGVLNSTIVDLIQAKKSDVVLEDERQIAYKEKVLKSFMYYDKLKSIPVQRKKRLIVLEKIIECFEHNKSYTEKEVNDIIKAIYDDFCTIRRELVEEKLLKRMDGIYTRV